MNRSNGLAPQTQSHDVMFSPDSETDGLQQGPVLR